MRHQHSESALYPRTMNADRGVPGEITQLLNQWEQGDPIAFENLAPLVYQQIRTIADAYLRNERAGHTLQPTALVNEVFLDLLKIRRVNLRDRGHFFAFAARLARRILIDSARSTKRWKRGAGYEMVPLNPELAWLPPADSDAETLDLAAAIDELSALDPSKTKAIELRYFLGCTLEETADLLQTSKRTTERGLEFSLAWLRTRLAT